MEFERVVGNKKDYLPLLLLADEQEDMIDRYLDKGEMYLAKDPEVVGECVVCKVDDGVYEIKNIATDPALHGKGYGRALIEYVMEQYRGKGHTMLVGTGDSPLTVPFYQRCGFTEHHRVKNFFLRQLRSSHRGMRRDALRYGLSEPPALSRGCKKHSPPQRLKRCGGGLLFFRAAAR